MCQYESVLVALSNSLRGLVGDLSTLSLALQWATHERLRETGLPLVEQALKDAHAILAFRTRKGRVPRCADELDAWRGGCEEWQAYKAAHPVEA